MTQSVTMARGYRCPRREADGDKKGGLFPALPISLGRDPDQRITWTTVRVCGSTITRSWLTIA